jgi:hypothetical protein
LNFCSTRITMEIIKKISVDVDHEEIFVKDMALVSFQRKFPEFLELSRAMRKHLPDNYKNYLVDLMVLNCTKGKYTCKDISWHFDGRFDSDNKYVLWVKGPNRTLFPKNIPFLDPPDDRILQKEYLEKKFFACETVEVPEETIVSYDSSTPHRGVSCEVEGKRHFLRMMASNYINPKNLVKK